MDKKIRPGRINRPDYKKIYTDIIMKRNPEKMSECLPILEKDDFSLLDILLIEKIIFGKQEEKHSFNQRHRYYDWNTVLEILEYQRKQNLNNTQLAFHFKLSRNTVTKWRKMFYQNKD
ncbi:helix-turn-helix domain-containing protein [Chryseobacterium limigenitum]|uniref:helix-turn-helix domain-containing protein n=1 Tax=Chryseobacterium limigenitum TaxID=1612149 RepID=UPI003396FB8F